MRNIFETLGELISELIGAGIVLAGICGALVLFRLFGDKFIGYFI